MEKNKLPNITSILGQNTLIERIQLKLEEIEHLAQNLGIKDIFRNKKFIEVAAAHRLGHEWNDKPYGPDAYELIDEKRFPTEYKSAKVGGSFQFHWLSVSKMLKIQECKNVYFLITEGVSIKEIYTIPTEKILQLIAEKASGGKSINGHKSFSLPQLISLGADRVA